MNSFDLACSILSSAAYREGFKINNRIDPPPGATPLPGALGYKTIAGLSGFEASAFEYGGKIVIAYAGTNTDQKVDLAADGALALGITHPQLLQAAEFYQAIKNNPAYAGKEVVFTGHSLGGGLAGAMGVFFNKQAVTFDPAPFRLAATQATADQIKAFLASKHPEWPTDSDLASYATVESRVGLHAPTLNAGSFTQLCRRTRRASVPARLRARGRGACGGRLALHQHLGLHATSAATANWLRRSGTATRHVGGLGGRGGEEVQAQQVHSMRVIGLKRLGRRMDRASSTLSDGVPA